MKFSRSIKTSTKGLKQVFLVTFLFLIAACSDKDSNYKPNSEFFYQLSKEEQVKFAPTEIFRAVYRNDFNEFLSALENSKDNLIKKNIEDDTALAVALKLQRKEMILPYVEKLTLDELLVPNSNGRSFVSLFAEYDAIEAFQILQSKYINQLNPLQNLNPLLEMFSYYDFPDTSGKNAAHYVVSKTFMDLLASTWFLRSGDSLTIWSNLYYQLDNDGNTFLHTAAEFNKYDIIRWFTDQYCGSEPFEGDWMITQGIDTVVWSLGKGVQYVQDKKYGPIWRRFINSKNNLENTALHLAAASGNPDSVSALLRCEEINPVMVNVHNQTPLTFMLSQLDVNNKNIQADFKKVFHLLSYEINPMTLWPGYDFKYYANLQDEFGGNAIIYSSRLSDKYFFEELKNIDLGLSDLSGLSADDSQ